MRDAFSNFLLRKLCSESLSYRAVFILPGIAGIGFDPKFHSLDLHICYKITTFVSSLSIFLFENFVFCNTVRNYEENWNLISLWYNIICIFVYICSIITQVTFNAK